MLLSICIPTYNRAPELRQLLDSIAAQSNYNIPLEIVISDNASTDNTGEMVADYIASGMNIVYHRFTENRGFDRNILNAIELASGDYCWLFGSDDVMEANALARVQHALHQHPGVSAISVGSQGYSKDMSRHVHVVDNVSTRFSDETLLHGREAPAATIGPWIGYMTGLIVKRSQWQAGISRAPIAPYLRGYVHLYIAMKMLDADSTWLCIPDRLVGCRTNNEAFVATDEFSRTRLDMENFELVFGDALGRDSQGYHRAIEMVAGYFIYAHFLNAKMGGVSLNYWRQALPEAIQRYWRYKAFWIKPLPLALAPRPVLLLARRAYRSIKRGGGSLS